MTSVVANLPEGPQFKIAQDPETNMKIRLRKQLISLQSLMSAPLPAETNCEAYERMVQLLAFIVSTITWIQFFKRSLRVTVAGAFLPHGTIERRPLGR